MNGLVRFSLSLLLSAAFAGCQNSGSSVTATFNVGETRIEIVGSIEKNGIYYFAPTPVELKISAGDPKLKVLYSLNGEPFRPWTTETLRFDSLSPGEHQLAIDAFFPDHAASRSQGLVRLVIDDQPPFGSPLVIGNYPNVANRTVRFDFSSVIDPKVESVAGVGSLSASVSLSPEPGGWKPIEEQPSVTLPDDDGPHSVWVWSRDQLDNVTSEPQKYDFFLDRVPPGGSLTLPETTPVRSLEIPLSASLDPAPSSGLKRIRVCVQPHKICAGWIPYTGQASVPYTLPEVIQPNDTATIELSLEDEAGNVGTLTDSITYTPGVGTFSVSMNSGDPYTHLLGVTASLYAHFPQGSVKEMCVSATPTFSPNCWVPFTPSFLLSLQLPEGHKSVYAQFRSTSGELSPTVSDSIILDQTPPTGTIEINDGDKRTVRRSVMLTLDISDNFSSLAEIEMKLSNFDGSDSTGWISASLGPIPWVLSGADADEGTRTVVAEFRDRASLLPTTSPYSTLSSGSDSIDYVPIPMMSASSTMNGEQSIFVTFADAGRIDEFKYFGGASLKVPRLANLSIRIIGIAAVPDSNRIFFSSSDGRIYTSAGVGDVALAIDSGALCGGTPVAPTALFAARLGKNDYLLAADSSNHRLVRWSCTGAQCTSCEEFYFDSTVVPLGVSFIDSKILVSDLNDDRVLILTWDGQVETTTNAPNRLITEIDDHKGGYYRAVDLASSEYILGALTEPTFTSVDPYTCSKNRITAEWHEPSNETKFFTVHNGEIKDSAPCLPK